MPVPVKPTLEILPTPRQIEPRQQAFDFLAVTDRMQPVVPAQCSSQSPPTQVHGLVFASLPLPPFGWGLGPAAQTAARSMRPGIRWASTCHRFGLHFFVSLYHPFQRSVQGGILTVHAGRKKPSELLGQPVFNVRLSWCSISISASLARSAGERVSRAAASLASRSPWSIAAVPSPSPWSTLRAAQACGGVPSGVVWRVSAFAFSASLVQAVNRVDVSSDSAIGSVVVLAHSHGGSRRFESCAAHFPHSLSKSELSYLPLVGRGNRHKSKILPASNAGFSRIRLALTLALWISLPNMAGKGYSIDSGIL